MIYLGPTVVQKMDKPSHWIILHALNFYKATGLLDTVYLHMGPLERDLSGRLLYPMFEQQYCSQVDSSIIQHFNVQPGSACNLSWLKEGQGDILFLYWYYL